MPARVLALVLVLLLAACARGAEAPSVERRAAVPGGDGVPAGYRLHAIREAGLVVAFPRRWSVLSRRDVRAPGVLQTLTLADARLGRLAAGLLAPASPQVLLAFERGSRSGFATTVSVLEIAIPAGTAYARWSRDALAAVRRLRSLHGEIRSRRVALPLGDSLRMEYVRAGAEGVPRLATVQYVVAAGDRGYVMTLSTLPRLQGEYERVVDASVRTLRSTA